MPRRLYKCDMDKQYLRSWREDRGFTQTELAALLGISWSTIQSWEVGRRGIAAWLPVALKGLEAMDRENAS